jgi:hypothetical protein
MSNLDQGWHIVVETARKLNLPLYFVQYQNTTLDVTTSLRAAKDHAAHYTGARVMQQLNGSLTPCRL